MPNSDAFIASYILTIFLQSNIKPRAIAKKYRLFRIFRTK